MFNLLLSKGSETRESLATETKFPFAKKFLSASHPLQLPHTVFCVLLSLLFLMACSPSNRTEFLTPFELSSFLKHHIQELPGQTVKFQILDFDGEPIPHEVLHFEWTEGGRIGFQTEQDGTVTMQFEKDMLENEVMVFAKSEDAKIRVIW